MPPDTTKPMSTRRPRRKITEEEMKDIELKRIRGELSCAECRRLKLRCDKKVPCGSCCRRGCESICPCGILSAGQGTRFILADTNQLHRKIADMSHRIRQLEDALAILHATVSDERHPLLQDDLLKIKFGPEAPDGSPSPTTGTDQMTTHSIDGLGSLTLDDSGEIKYFGRSAGSETLMTVKDESDESDEEDKQRRPSPVHPEIENLANVFPVTKKKRCNTRTLQLLESYLPSHERAVALCESYLNHAANFFRPIKRSELLDEFMPGIYKAAAANAKDDTSSSPSDESDSCTPAVPRNTPHALATLYFVFALGALLDLTLQPYNAEAEHYYDLGRSSLSLRVIFGSPQIDTVQAMGLMATYHCLAGKSYSRDSAWCVMSFAAKLAQGIGLHRDSARWNMDPKTVQKRRTLFWEVFTADISHSLALGRPPAIHLSFVDCEFPIDEEASVNEAGELQNGFWRVKYIFGRDMFSSVAEAILKAKPPSYTTVLDLDRKVRELSYPTAVKPYVRREDGEEEFFSSSLSLQGFYASQHRTVTMLYLHRSYFAQAMLDHPSNPLLSPFAPSFLTAYRCASVIIKASSHQFDRCAEMAMRVWFLMYHTFSAAVIVGTVVTRSPNSNIAASALQDLCRAVDLFERTALQSQRAKVALGVLHKLKEKAIRSYTQYTSTQGTSPSPIPHQLAPLTSEQQAADDGDDELAIFGGQTRVLSRKTRSRRSVTSLTGSDSASPPAECSLSPSPTIPHIAGATQMSVADIHPSLLQYLGPSSFLGDHRASSTAYAQAASPESSKEMSVSPPPEVHSPLPALNGVNGHHASSDLPAGDQMANMFSLFMDFVTSQSSTNGPTSSSRSVSNSNSFPFSPSPNREWREFSPDVNGLPKPDMSFGWLPLAKQKSQTDFNQQHGPVNPPRPSTSEHFTGNANGSQSQPPQNPTMSSMPFTQFEHFWGEETHHRGHEQPSMPPWNRDTPMAIDPAGALLELGLMTESDIDSGWFSFMQDCGIMDTSGSN